MNEPSLQLSELVLPEDDERVKADIAKWAGKTHEVCLNANNH
jgi:hypothetical protein